MSFCSFTLTRLWANHVLKKGKYTSFVIESELRFVLRPGDSPDRSDQSAASWRRVPTVAVGSQSCTLQGVALGILGLN